VYRYGISFFTNKKNCCSFLINNLVSWKRWQFVTLINSGLARHGWHIFLQEQFVFLFPLYSWSFFTLCFVYLFVFLFLLYLCSFFTLCFVYLFVFLFLLLLLSFFTLCFVYSFVFHFPLYSWSFFTLCFVYSFVFLSPLYSWSFFMFCLFVFFNFSIRCLFTAYATVSVFCFSFHLTGFLIPGSSLMIFFVKVGVSNQFIT
jgi:hypothetical protein